MSEGHLFESHELGLEESDVTDTCNMIFEDSILNTENNKPADSAFSVFGLRFYMSQLVLLSVSRLEASAGRL